MKNHIEIKNLELKYDKIKIFDDLSLDIREKEFLVLLGPSGCGKSTLLNCIAGLLDINDGQIFINGDNVTWAEPKDRGVGMVFQSYALYPKMSVRGNLSFSLKNQRIPKDEINERIKYASSILQIEHLLDRKPFALSGGQRQRVAIGRALVRDVDVFLFDEPLSNLDAKLRTELRLELKHLHTKLQNTMVYVTHDQVEAMTLADRIVILDGGVIAQLDTPDNIYHKPSNLFVAKFIGSPNINLFNGTVDKGNKFIINDITTGQTQDLSEYNGTLSQGGSAILGIRPENIRLKEQSTSKSALTGTVSFIEPMGPENIIWLELENGHSISVRVQNQQKYPADTNLYVELDNSKASVFDTKTEQRL